MIKLGTKGIKTLKVTHLILIMAWTCGVVTMAILSLMKAHNGDELYMIFRTMRFIDNCLVIPGATLTVLTGVVYGVWTNWGFFKHRWITIKWIAGISTIIIGTFILSPALDYNLATANELREFAFSDVTLQSNVQLVFISGCTLSVILIFLIIISVFKPWKKKKI